MNSLKEFQKSLYSAHRCLVPEEQYISKGIETAVSYVKTEWLECKSKEFIYVMGFMIQMIEPKVVRLTKADIQRADTMTYQLMNLEETLKTDIEYLYEIFYVDNVKNSEIKFVPLFSEDNVVQLFKKGYISWIGLYIFLTEIKGCPYIQYKTSKKNIFKMDKSDDILERIHQVVYGLSSLIDKNLEILFFHDHQWFSEKINDLILNKEERIAYYNYAIESQRKLEKPKNIKVNFF